MRRSILPALGVAAGLGAVVVGRRRTGDGRDAFYEWNGERAPLRDHGPVRFSLPLTGHRTEQVISVHAVAFEPVRALLPTDELHPVRLPDGRAILALSAARYLESTADGMDPYELPYGESMITVFVTPRPSRRLLPLIRGMLPGRGVPTYGGFMIHNAVSYWTSRDMSRALGYPAFTADFAFEDDLAERRRRVSDDGRDLFGCGWRRADGTRWIAGRSSCTTSGARSWWRRSAPVPASSSRPWDAAPVAWSLATTPSPTNCGPSRSPLGRS